MTEKMTTAPPAPEADLIDPRYITIKGARVNNLRNVNLRIPKNRLIVVTGLSGSGKSSITMDTLYAEGQRRYVESLSSYARQFLGRIKKPDVDYIRGICPAIAIEQRVTTGNARSTVGSMTEIFDYLRLLYARIARFYSPISGREVRKQEVSDVVDYARALPEGAKVLLLAPFSDRYAERNLQEEFRLLLQRGFSRVWMDGEIIYIEDALSGQAPRFQLDQPLSVAKARGAMLLADRLVVKPDDDAEWMRFADSVRMAFFEGEGTCMLVPLPESPDTTLAFSNRFEADGIEFPEPTPQLFSYNNPYGACPLCEGYGRILGIDPDKVFPDPTLSVYQDGIAPWKGEERRAEWLGPLIRNANRFDFPLHTPIGQLSDEECRLLWEGNAFFRGLNAFFQELESKTYKIQNRVTLARFRGRTTCPACGGKRLRKEALCAKINGRDISDLTGLPVDELYDFFKNLQLSEYDRQVAERLLLEIENRLRFMTELGLGYLTLDRVSNTLSGGETQRIHLTRTLGSNLTASMYLLDEPSVGLHPRDTDRLVQVLKRLRDLGNTVVVVEHEESVIRNADFLVDMGPEAGVNGGEVVYAGPFADLERHAPNSLTAQYLFGQRSIPIPATSRPTRTFIEIIGARRHNLQGIHVKIPLNALVVVSGVSGSGKTTLVRDILIPLLQSRLGVGGDPAGQYQSLDGAVKSISSVEFINQGAIGKSSRSNPVTYVKAYDFIRDLFAAQPRSRMNGFEARHFSFNVEGGRCEACQGEGEQVVEMQFLADVRLECEECRGRRFRREVLEVEYKGKNIFDVLSMSIGEALDFFADRKEIVSRIKPLFDVGLGYVKLGQSSSTLSGGEAQRVKLASFLIHENASQPHIFFVFDEPTTGLHFHDIVKLLKAVNALVDRGHTALIVEHNLDVIKTADWVVDLGPEGGKGGGRLLYQGPPAGLCYVSESHTGRFLREKMI